MKNIQKLPTTQEFAQTIAKAMWGQAAVSTPFRSHLQCIADAHQLPLRDIRLSPQGQELAPNAKKVGNGNFVMNSGSSLTGISNKSFAQCASNSNCSQIKFVFDSHPRHQGLVWAAFKS